MDARSHPSVGVFERRKDLIEPLAEIGNHMTIIQRNPVLGVVRRRRATHQHRIRHQLLQPSGGLKNGRASSAWISLARQTGKRTLVRRPELFPNHKYLTLDDVLLREEARRDPELFLERGDRFVIDEMQHAPDLLFAVKRRVDENRVRGRYVLTGSSNLPVQRNVSENLAGRAGADIPHLR